jgi:hypothetical protein
MEGVEMIKVLACAAAATAAVAAIGIAIAQAGSAASPPRCAAVNLRPVYHVMGCGGGGCENQVVLRNMGARTCQLSGFPAVQNYRADGRPLPTTVTHKGTPHTVILFPGQRAVFKLSFADPGVAGCRVQPAEMTVRVPNTTWPVIADGGAPACKGALTETPLVHA